ncbi:YdcF family protein [Corynebacterium sp. TAE3-ERU12]|uniref:YdcF family protein n=1 Tax=Corynebacterium sp. TAE3-ERU12 TaxID=2849491 RepID=UPI001C47EA00|nr:YdcF family protein [Corynebacterium sp. TAE3-ERU12]MBV7295033.1 YdcF family protein [Corynebacterium sp. TAE3-ERU12]
MLSPRAVVTAAAGSATVAVLVGGGLRAWCDPLMQPPKLPKARPPVWGLPTLGALTAVGIAALSPVADAPQRPRWQRVLAAAGLIAPAMPGAMVPAFELARRYWARTRTGPVGTVVVLGCALRGNEPSELLEARLETAYRIITTNPVPVDVIVSGGQGSDEISAEARVMGQWFAQRGISAIEETQSTSTAENLDYSAPMVTRWPVVAVSSDFHVFRIRDELRARGLHWHVTGAPTPVRYWATAMLREFLAVGLRHPLPGLTVGVLLSLWSARNIGHSPS